MIVMNRDTDENREVMSVSDLNHAAKRMLEGEFPMVFVEGEISNFAAPRSGHWYFTLKDDNAQLRCAMFKGRNQRIRFVPRDGNQIIVRGKISLFEARGDYQLIAEHMEDAGDGALRRAFEQLKQRLQVEGLFDAERKQPIPSLPDHVAIITSQHGAAIHDVLSVMERRFPAIRATVIPVQVQGDESIGQIVKAIQVANDYEADPFDLILLTRGGGSLEDFWSFNTEQVARAVSASRLPIVCAVGHESDVSIADFVADLRAPTPSAAAELITPNQLEWQEAIASRERALKSELADAIYSRSQHLDHLARRIRNPVQRLADLRQRIVSGQARLRANMRHQLGQFNPLPLQQRLSAAVTGLLAARAGQLAVANKGLVNPATRLRQSELKLTGLNQRLVRSMQQDIARSDTGFQHLVQKLNALSPLKVLDRGYAVITTGDQHVVTAADQVKTGDTIVARLASGQLNAEVKDTQSES